MILPYFHQYGSVRIGRKCHGSAQVNVTHVHGVENLLSSNETDPHSSHRGPNRCKHRLSIAWTHLANQKPHLVRTVGHGQNYRRVLSENSVIYEAFPIRCRNDTAHPNYSAHGQFIICRCPEDVTTYSDALRTRLRSTQKQHLGEGFIVPATKLRTDLNKPQGILRKAEKLALNLDIHSVQWGLHRSMGRTYLVN